MKSCLISTKYSLEELAQSAKDAVYLWEKRYCSQTKEYPFISIYRDSIPQKPLIADVKHIESVDLEKKVCLFYDAYDILNAIAHPHIFFENYD